MLYGLIWGWGTYVPRHRCWNINYYILFWFFFIVVNLNICIYVCWVVCLCWMWKRTKVFESIVECLEKWMKMRKMFLLFIFNACFWESQCSGTGTGTVDTYFFLFCLGNLIFINTVFKISRFFWGRSDDLFDTGFLMWVWFM